MIGTPCGNKAARGWIMQRILKLFENINSIGVWQCQSLRGFKGMVKLLKGVALYGIIVLNKGSRSWIWEIWLSGKNW